MASVVLIIINYSKNLLHFYSECMNMLLSCTQTVLDISRHIRLPYKDLRMLYIYSIFYILIDWNFDVLEKKVIWTICGIVWKKIKMYLMTLLLILNIVKENTSNYYFGHTSD